MMFNPEEHMMDLKGRKYLQVAWRLVWFRLEKPLWNIETQLVQLADDHAVFAAKIYDENGAQKSSGYGSESVKDFRDFIEKAETKAVGRALAMLGYGTQFAPELDEGDRIVDAPMPAGKKPAGKPAEAPAVQTPVCEQCGAQIKPLKLPDGTVMLPDAVAARSKDAYGRTLCVGCMNAAKAEREREDKAC